MRPRWIWIGAIVAAGIVAPRLAAAGVELSLRAPVGVAIGGDTRFELGLRSDLLYVFEHVTNASNLGLGITGEVRSVSFSQRAQEIGAEVAWLERVGGGVSMGPALDAGFGTAGTRQYLVGRLSYQLRAGFGNETLDYAAATAIFLGARRSISGPEGTELIVGVEIGGGLIAAWFRMVQSIVNSG